MTRATRSTTVQEKEKVVDPPPTTSKKAATKKRKRTSIAEHTDQPANKLVRTEDSIKEEGGQDLEEQHAEAVTKLELPSSGDVPIRAEDAEKILDVLEMTDTQGLLDRIFPLPSDHTSDAESVAGPSTGTQSYSFRALLKAAPPYPLKMLRAAVQHLFPISSHPRSRPSAPAAEQLRFCQLALSLLDQASFYNSPIPLDVASFIPSGSSFSNVEGEGSAQSSNTFSKGLPLNKRRYALVQRLPTGDWWSSLDSSYPSAPQDGKEAKDLATSHAELVAIFPSSSASRETVTLGNYVKKNAASKTLHVPQPRKMPCGSFLDYGPYASFAPTFEQNGVEIGRNRLSEVVWYKQLDQRRRERVRIYKERIASREASAEEGDESVVEDDTVETEKPNLKQKEKMTSSDLSELEGLLSPEQVASLRSALDSLELEKAVFELLDRNARALAGLEVLQLERLSREGPTKVEIGSEEWNTAQGILDSLTLLASLRPRSSVDADAVSLIPPASVIRKLHRTLPIDSTQGWYGTLPDNRATAVRDDTTVRVLPGSSAPAAAAPAAPSAPAPAPTAQPAPPPPAKPSTSSYNSYAYPGYTTPYRGSYGTYTPGKTNYYPNYQPSMPPAQTTTTTHYPNHQYQATGQQPYAYNSWYNYQPPNSASGQGTPQAKSSYPNYFTNTHQPQPQRAVANTVLTAGAAASRTYAAGTWTPGSTAYVPPTLPPHLRGGTSTPSTPGPGTTTPGVSYQGYYNTYQPPPTPTPAQ